ncbi:CBP80/20-dependent translation initiation factor isoform X1 [Ictalurus punctatus]|uniref:CBP80/20-dependent translation initiation factor isoform X1 n=1 Tax=Ictalurus punctatus TaxID=7998 RepID=A0A2D0T0I8_ICTPU|nr:CBP80/20-dependent translation initiation factor isoform X1 [Ictalurus punctatus]XP_017348437.2 CBP80/20-dependent translation initiation factor isoform X1 [Ictalurus punctatus]XP_047017602.2 CBP80/20-dependent translation initiation factor isoform X1 [Ictalurus punctatus]
MESSSVASASSEAGSTRSQEIEELERFIDSYVLEYQVQGLLNDKNENENDNADKTQSNISQWTEDCCDKIDGSWSSSRGRGSSKPDEWEHSSNGSTGSRPSSGSRPGSGSRSGSQGRNKPFCVPSKNGNRDGSFDILGTDIWAANTMDSHGGATWDLQPEKLDFSQFHMKQYRGAPKHLPHIDREGLMKSRFEDDSIDLNDIEKFLPTLSVFPPLPNEAEIAHTKKLFRHRRNDRRYDRRHAEAPQDELTVLLLPCDGKRQVSRRQQRPPGGGGGSGGGGVGGGGGPKSHNPQQQQQHQQVPLHSQQQHHTTSQPQQLFTDPQSEGVNAKHGHGGRGYQCGQQGRGHHHGYSQNRRWHQQHRQPGQRNTKETDSLKEEENEYKTARVTENTRGDDNRTDGKQEKTDGGKVSLLQSSKERLRRRLKEKEEVPVATPGPQRNRMDKLLEILNSMRSNSSGVEAQLASFMEEAQSSAQSEETLGEIVHTIYSKAVRDRGFAATAAKLCYKMALFMVEGTKFRSLLLNMLQRDFTRREELQQTDVESWLGFITFLCEVFSTMRSSTGEPFRVLVCPIYTCLRELLESAEVKEDAVLCCSMELQSAGRLLEEQLPEMMMELLAAVRDKMLGPSESPLTRSLLMEVIELHAHQWSPLEALTTQYYNRTIQKLTA